MTDEPQLEDEGPGPDLEEFLEDRPRDGATVIRKRAGRLDLETFAPILAQTLAMYRGDATKLCMQESPILLDNVEPAKAKAVAAALREHGEECLVIAAADLIELPRAQPAHSARLTQENLELLDSTRRATAVPWGKVIVLALGHVPVESATKRPTGGSLLTQKVKYAGVGGMMGGVTGMALGSALQSAAGGSGTKTVTSSALHSLVEIVSVGPLQRFRIDGREFDYSILGKQQQAGSELNVQTLVRWFAHYMPGARANFDRETLASTGRVNIPRYSSLGFRQTVQWLVNLVRHDRPDAPPG